MVKAYLEPNEIEQLENEKNIGGNKMGKTLDPEQLKTLLSPNPEDILIKPREKKDDTGKILTIKLSDEEASTVQAFQDFLFDWGYTPDNTFESAFIYIFNLACALHKPVVEFEAKRGRAFNPEDLAPKTQD
jgi:hypothetical protein